jgi:hypothetical protein
VDWPQYDCEERSATAQARTPRVIKHLLIKPWRFSTFVWWSHDIGQPPPPGPPGWGPLIPARDCDRCNSARSTRRSARPPPRSREGDSLEVTPSAIPHTEVVTSSFTDLGIYLWLFVWAFARGHLVKQIFPERSLHCTRVVWAMVLVPTVKGYLF